MKKFKKVIAVALAAAVVMTGVMAVPTTSAQAATKTVTATKSYKKAPVLKSGTAVVKMKKKDYYVKFKAPSAGTYKLTFTQLKHGSGNEIGLGDLYVSRHERGFGPLWTTVKTNGGKKTQDIALCSKFSWNNFEKAEYTGKASDWAYTRTATLKLKKGEVIYVNGSASIVPAPTSADQEMPAPYTNFQYKVTIKKVK